jgi:hypothetical protein
MVTIINSSVTIFGAISRPGPASNGQKLLHGLSLP